MKVVPCNCMVQNLLKGLAPKQSWMKTRAQTALQRKSSLMTHNPSDEGRSRFNNVNLRGLSFSAATDESQILISISSENLLGFIYQRKS